MEPYLSRIRKAIIEAVNGYYTGPQYISVRHILSARSAASICHDHIKAAIIAEFDGEPGIHISEKRSLFTLAIKGIVVLRFKKFNKNLLSSGINTRQQTAFNLQQTVQLEMDDLVPNGLLHVGYVLNTLGTEVHEVHITYRYGNVNIWNIPLTADVAAETVIFPTVSPAATSTIRTRTVKAKDTKETVGDKNASNT